MATLLDALERDYVAREIKGLAVARVQAKPIRAFFGHEKASAVTSDRIRVYQGNRKKLGRANATINRETEILSRAYRLAVDERRLSAQFAPKVPSLPRKNARQRFFEKHELEALLPHLPEPVDDMTRFAGDLRLEAFRDPAPSVGRRRSRCA